MAGAALGIYGNSKEEAMYPVLAVDSKGEKLNGANRYTLHFPEGALPRSMRSGRQRCMSFRQASSWPIRSTVIC